MGGRGRNRGHCRHLFLASQRKTGPRDGALMLPGGHLLSVLIFFPAVGALALLLLRGDDHKFIRIIALIVSLAEFLFSLLMIRAVPIGAAGYHLEEYLKWINQPPINYHLGVDGISLFLVILTTFLTPISILASWKSIEHRVKEFFVMLLMLEDGSIALNSWTEMLLFLAFFLAFAIKVPLFPLHTWLPDAHVEAPTAGSVMLAGVLLKMGTYGMIRFCLPLFPGASRRASGWVAVLAIIGVIYGALVAMVQPNLKKLVAYSSVSHLGFVVLGIFAFHNISMQGAVYQMLAHGISTGALFLLVGMLYDRRHTFEIGEYGGLATPMPKLSAFFLFVALSSLGLPMLNGFVGEYLVLLGTYQRHWQWATWAALGVILSACYLLWSYQRGFFGEITREKNRTLPDASAREKWILATVAVVTLWMGIGSTFITKRTAAAAQDVIDQVEPQRPYEAAAPNIVAPNVLTTDGATTRAKQIPSSAATKVALTERLGTR